MYNIQIDNSRNSLFTGFSHATIKDRYLLPGETPQQMFKRVASAFADNEDHANRLYTYFSKHWAMPSTPILSNGGTDRGLPISCYLTSVGDNLTSIAEWFTESLWLASGGGGLGADVSALRSIGERVGGRGSTTGIIPFLKVFDSQTMAISQGSLRRGSAASYLRIDHPEINEFIDIRKASGGDVNRKCLNLHHGIIITDAFMLAVETGSEWNLVSPKDGSTVKTVSARELWINILTTRLETGEPYMLFIDAVNKVIPEHHKLSGLNVRTSNLCSEITLPTGMDHLGKHRTAVCCLASLNLEYYLEWKDNAHIVPDLLRFLDNVLQYFIDNAPDTMHRAKYSAIRERSVGLGVMGFHGFLQSQNLPFGCAVAKSWNKQIFKHIRTQANITSKLLATERGSCPDAAEHGIDERFSSKLAVAPTASISIIAGNATPGIDPITANAYTQKTLSGSFSVRNKYLESLLAVKSKNTPEVWSSITTNKGSVQHLDFLSTDEKDIFKTAWEINNEWIIIHAADRTPYICQAQSVNLFLPADIDKKELHKIHFTAWKSGLKSLYYVRSMSIQRAENVSKNDGECLSCQ